MRFNHAFDFAFEINSNCEDASDVDAKKVRNALLTKVMTLSDKELLAAASCFDTMDEVKPERAVFAEWKTVTCQGCDKTWTVPVQLDNVVVCEKCR